MLHIGTLIPSGKPFGLPEDLSDVKLAMLAQSKKGKTYGLGVILEELWYAGRPWIATDPANNLYGLRVKPDGSPSELNVAVIGGTYGDIPFEKDSGERLAEALLATPICAVIDIAFESLGTIRHFMTAFAGRLMRAKPEIPRVLFFEEAQVLIPQKARGPQMEVCKAAVSKLAIVGGNFGYGVVVASQRAATIDKDVLSQCEGLIVMGMTHRKDRETVREWIESKGIDEQVSKCFDELGSLAPGEAWYWNPGEDRLEKFIFRKRHTLHPREMKRLKIRPGEVQLGDSTNFIEKLRKELSRTVVSVPETPRRGRIVREPDPSKHSLVRAAEFDRLQKENEDLRSKFQDLHEQLATMRRSDQDAQRRLAAVRESLRPQYDALRGLFEQLSTSSGNKPSNPGVFSKWLQKAPKVGMKTMLEHLLETGSATRQQLATVAGVARTTSYDYIGWILRNGLAEDNGKEIVLRKVNG
jgi:hypothetical protein